MIKNIERILLNLNTNDEFEVIYNVKKGICMKDIKKLKEEYKDNGIITKTLDIIVNSYRMSINGIENINKFYKDNYNNSNYEIFNSIIQNDEVNVIRKDMNTDINKYDDKYDIKYKLYNEKSMNTKDVASYIKLKRNESIVILFRYKNRLTYNVFEDNNVIVKLDITIVQTSNNIKRILTNDKKIEIEMEYYCKKKGMNDNNNAISE